MPLLSPPIAPRAPRFSKIRGSGGVREAAVLAVGVAVAITAHHFFGAIGVLTWAVLLGAIAGNTGLTSKRQGAGPGKLAKVLLRFGIILLGFSLSLQLVIGLGWQLFVLVAACLVGTLTCTYWVARWLGLPHSRGLLIAVGFSICGASAIAAMEETARADEDDVATAIALVTLFGTAMMIAVPLLQVPLGLSNVQLGVWAGASVQEVGQVVAAAGSAGTAAVSIAVVVKLTRVLFLAPVVVGAQLVQRRRSTRHERVGETDTPPLVPAFILGFLVCVLVRTTGVVPVDVLHLIGNAQTIALAAALFGLGLGVDVKGMLISSGRSMVVASLATALIAVAALVGVFVVL